MMILPDIPRSPNLDEAEQEELRFELFSESCRFT